MSRTEKPFWPLADCPPSHSRGPHITPAACLLSPIEIGRKRRADRQVRLSPISGSDIANRHLLGLDQSDPTRNQPYAGPWGVCITERRPAFTPSSYSQPGQAFFQFSTVQTPTGAVGTTNCCGDSATAQPDQQASAVTRKGTEILCIATCLSFGGGGPRDGEYGNPNTIGN